VRIAAPVHLTLTPPVHLTLTSHAFTALVFAQIDLVLVARAVASFVLAPLALAELDDIARIASRAVIASGASRIVRRDDFDLVTETL
jgi:hypothetical protein